RLTIEPVVAICASQDAHRMHGADSGVLLKLQRGQRAIGCPDFGRGFLHALECFSADSCRGFESFDCHCVRAVMAATFHHSRWRDPGNFPQQISTFETNSLGAKMARRVVGNLLSWCAAEIRIETRFLTDRPEELAWIHNRRRDLFRG